MCTPLFRKEGAYRTAHERSRCPRVCSKVREKLPMSQNAILNDCNTTRLTSEIGSAHDHYPARLLRALGRINISSNPPGSLLCHTLHVLLSKIHLALMACLAFMRLQKTKTVKLWPSTSLVFCTKSGFLVIHENSPPGQSCPVSLLGKPIRLTFSQRFEPV
jgi:hypothetical protein